MTKEEILKADEQTLRARRNVLIDDIKTYEPGPSELNMEYLMICERLALLMNQIADAIVYSEDLWNRYRETLI